MLDAPIKTIGKHTISIAVHPEVEVEVTVTVARSADEAERINRGEDISTRQEDQDAAAEALAAAGEFFDPEAQAEQETGTWKSKAVRLQVENTARPANRPGVSFCGSNAANTIQICARHQRGSPRQLGGRRRRLIWKSAAPAVRQAGPVAATAGAAWR